LADGERVRPPHGDAAEMVEKTGYTHEFVRRILMAAGVEAATEE
jgi:hypothetical protein